MPRLLKHFLILAGISTLTTIESRGQCGAFISNLSDTIPACKNTKVQLNATVNSTGTFFKVLDTVWTPATGLTNPNIINPIAAVGTTSQGYKLTVHALTANNFVTNGNFSAGNTGFTTSYVVGTGGTWGLLSLEGTYGVSSNPNLLHSNFSSFYDHTSGTSAGSMLVVNGASVANVNIWCQTITVVPNTTYDFSAWGASCTSSSPAILQFAINGNLLGTPLNLPSTTAQWVQFHTTWFSGSNTSIQICITDQQTAVSGNDFAIDDIEFREVCTVTDSTYIAVTNMQPQITQNVKLGCLSDTLEVQAQNNGGDVPAQYVWDFGDGTGATTANAQHIYPTQGQYIVKLVTKKNNCADSANVTIDTRHPLSIAIASDKDTVCAGGSVQFSNTDNGTTTLNYQWDFGDGSPIDNTSGPSHVYQNAGVYTVTHVVNDQVPCYDTAKLTIVVQPGPTATFYTSDTVICQGTAINFHSTVTDGYRRVNWNFGDADSIQAFTETMHSYEQAGDYTVTLTVDYPVCPRATVKKNVHVLPIPKVYLGRDTAMCPNSTPIPLYNHWTNGANINYLWNTGETTPSIMANAVGIYWLKASDTLGCSTSDSLEVFRNCYLNIPNAFTPDGDGNNEYFFPRQLLSSKLVSFHMQIFNRWGQLIFETFSTSGRGWDGKFNDKPQPSGVYVYIIEAQIEGAAPEKYKGNVTLLR